MKKPKRHRSGFFHFERRRHSRLAQAKLSWSEGLITFEVI
ncbi:hypothetical protein JOE34_000457 [Pseudomonas sp. PvP028]|nr:hypothetical protein [Pseudomonas sp. PvP028]